MFFNLKHERYMSIALQEAEKAYQQNEVPVGCVIANNEEILSQSHNEVEKYKNPLMHAEMIAINNACNIKGSKFLENYNIYITLEPCNLCLEAIFMVRLKKIFFATSSIKKIQAHSYKTEIYEGITAKILSKHEKDMIKLV
jgi:tRNA(adenine34) deaminase